MPRFWGIHSGIHIELENRHMLGKSLDYWVPVDDRMRAGDFVYLFRDNEYLYGYGVINSLAKPTLKADEIYRQVSVLLMGIGGNRFDVKSEIRSREVFQNYDRIKHQNLSSFNDEQVRYLNGLCRSNGSSPPDPAEARVDEERALPPMRPVVAKFVRGERLRMDETRFDEFKTVSSKNVVTNICTEVYGYVIGFLNLEDRRGEDNCRIFWGVTDKNRTIEGITLTEADRDQLRRDVGNKLARIKPPLAASARYIELHQVYDHIGAVIHDLYVVEVGIGHGERGAFYCSENDSFYIKEDGINTQLKGQALIAEIRRRVRGELMQAMREAQRA